MKDRNVSNILVLTVLLPYAAWNSGIKLFKFGDCFRSLEKGSVVSQDTFS